jgi:hypothetical protein
MRRPPSYSDSFLDYRQFTSPPFTPTSIQEILVEPVEEQEQKGGCGCCEWIETPLLLSIKGGVHIFTISIFETIFYFTYVSRSENTGILKTINTYYLPLVDACMEVNRTLRVDIWEFLQVLGIPPQAAVDAAAQSAATARAVENLKLLNWSIGYTGISAGITVFCYVCYRWGLKKELKWREVCIESLWFIVVLGLYEWFFFETIIYNYNTISTSELNQYIVDGLYTCLDGAMGSRAA